MSIGDWLHRLLMGDAPWLFLIEAIYRAVLVYVALLIAMRLMGKRISAMFGIAEWAVILMLGAAISSPMQMPTQGILSAVVVLGTVATLQRLLSWASYRRRSIELNVHGDVDCLVADGRLRIDRLQKTKISRELLLSELRAQGVLQLGELRRVYMEPNGRLSIIRSIGPCPGLNLAPGSSGPWPVSSIPGKSICACCGAPAHADSNMCPHCGRTEWTAPVRAC